MLPPKMFICWALANHFIISISYMYVYIYQIHFCRSAGQADSDILRENVQYIMELVKTNP